MKVKPKKALGQHFLNVPDIARRIALSIDAESLPDKDKQFGQIPILEIGPGMGILTNFLIQSGRPLKAVEIDDESVCYLSQNYPSLNIIEADFLKLDLDDIFPTQFALIGNYPYNISSQIFFRLLDYRLKIPVCAGMLQREVAQRICSQPGSKVYGILSVLLQAWYDCSYLFTVDENVFTPPPKVKSAVIRLVRNSRTSLGCDEKLFKTVVKTTFGQRRKTIRNSIGSLVPKNAPILADPIMKLRPEALSVDQFIQLTLDVQKARENITENLPR